MTKDFPGPFHVQWHTYSLDSQLESFQYDAAQPVSSFILWSSMDKLSKTSEIKNLAFQVKLLKFPDSEIFQSIGLQYRHTVWHQSSKSTVYLGLLTTAYAIWSCVRIRINLSFFEYIFSCLQNPCSRPVTDSSIGSQMMRVYDLFVISSMLYFNFSNTFLLSRTNTGIRVVGERSWKEREVRQF